MVEKISSRGQATIFIIIAVAIVAITGFVFFIFRGPSLIGGEEVQPNVFIEQCIEDGVEEALGIMLPQGGFINPKNSSPMYNNYNVEYVCYTKGYYISCVNQHPAYMEELETEIENYITPRIESCFEELGKGVERSDLGVEISEEMIVNVKFIPNRVEVNVDRDVEITSSETTQTFDKFESSVNHPMYDLTRVAIDIASQEARYCYFENIGYSLAYPNYLINQEMLSDGTKIYSIKDKASGEELMIAIRGCVAPTPI